MKSTPRRRQHQQAAASFAAEFASSSNAYVIHPPKTKWGPRRYWKELELAQEAITARFPNGLPERVEKSVRFRRLRKELEDRYGISRQTTDRALKVLRAANR